MKDKAAKVIRILSVPPIMVSALLLILFLSDRSAFSDPTELVVPLLLLGVCPVLAYPFQKMIPSLRAKGRDMQRKLAFIFTLVGYTAAFIWAVATKATRVVTVTTATYFFSVLLLTIVNLCFHFKASGHASSFTGPILILSVFTKWWTCFPTILIALAIAWSSVYLKRHTVLQLAVGGMISVLSFLAAFFLF